MNDYATIPAEGTVNTMLTDEEMQAFYYADQDADTTLQNIENRINEMDMAETEDLIVSILDKELKALVWFGVLLGFLLGFVTNII